MEVMYGSPYRYFIFMLLVDNWSLNIMHPTGRLWILVWPSGASKLESNGVTKPHLKYCCYSILNFSKLKLSGSVGRGEQTKCLESCVCSLVGSPLLLTRIVLSNWSTSICYLWRCLLYTSTKSFILLKFTSQYYWYSTVYVIVNMYNKYFLIKKNVL